MIGWIGFGMVCVGLLGLGVFALSGAEWRELFREACGQNRELRDLVASMHEASRRAAARRGDL